MSVLILRYVLPRRVVLGVVRPEDGPMNGVVDGESLMAMLSVLRDDVELS